MNRIYNISLKNFEEIEGHGDSRTFNADIYSGDVMIGYVNNDGRGGCNSYDFTSKVHEKKFMNCVKQWYEDNKNNDMVFTGHAEMDDCFIEYLIGELLLDRVLARRKKADVKKGCKITLFCREGKDFISLGKEKIFNGWKKEWTLGFNDMNDVEQYLSRNKVEEYRVL